MQPHPFERFGKSLASLAFAGKFDARLNEWISDRNNGRLAALHSVFEDYKYADVGTKWLNPAPVIQALKAVAVLDAPDRQAFVGDIRGILGWEHNSPFILNSALDSLSSMDDSALGAITEVGTLCHNDLFPLERALRTAEKLGMRIIETRNGIHFPGLNHAMGRLGQECSQEREPYEPELALAIWSRLGSACIRHGLEPMSSTVLNDLPQVQSASQQWSWYASHLGRQAVAGLEQAVRDAGDLPRLGEQCRHRATTNGLSSER